MYGLMRMGLVKVDWVILCSGWCGVIVMFVYLMCWFVEVGK